MILLAESHHSIRFSGHQVLGHLNDFYTIASVGGGAVAGGVDFSTRAFIFPRVVCGLGGHRMGRHGLTSFGTWDWT